jgi:predicted nucleic acid-binding protein
VATEPSAYVLDSFALLAYLEGETGRPRVKDLLRRAELGKCSLYLSVINLGEVLYITERENGLILAQRSLAAIDQLPLQIVPVSRITVLAAAHIKARYSISYADAFAVVTAQDQHCVLLTGDPEFRSVANDGLISVEWLTRH